MGESWAEHLSLLGLVALVRPAPAASEPWMPAGGSASNFCPWRSSDQLDSSVRRQLSRAARGSSSPPPPTRWSRGRELGGKSGLSGRRRAGFWSKSARLSRAGFAGGAGVGAASEAVLEFGGRWWKQQQQLEVLHSVCILTANPSSLLCNKSDPGIHCSF